MGFLPDIIFTIYGLGAVITLGILVYLVVKRIKTKKEETFEQRDN